MSAEKQSGAAPFKKEWREGIRASRHRTRLGARTSVEVELGLVRRSAQLVSMPRAGWAGAVGCNSLRGAAGQLSRPHGESRRAVGRPPLDGARLFLFRNAARRREIVEPRTS